MEGRFRWMDENGAALSLADAWVFAIEGTLLSRHVAGHRVAAGRSSGVQGDGSSGPAGGNAGGLSPGELDRLRSMAGLMQAQVPLLWGLAAGRLGAEVERRMAQGGGNGDGGRGDGGGEK